MAKHKIYTFYAELKDYEPTIWRRFEVNGEKTMAELSYIIMIMFEMRGSHLFQLREYTRDAWNKHIIEEYSIESEEICSELLDDMQDAKYEFLYDDVFEEDVDIIHPNVVRLSHTQFSGTEFLLEYDYGDGWEVSLVVEDIREENCCNRALEKSSISLQIG